MLKPMVDVRPVVAKDPAKDLVWGVLTSSYLIQAEAMRAAG